MSSARVIVVAIFLFVCSGALNSTPSMARTSSESNAVATNAYQAAQTEAAFKQYADAELRRLRDRAEFWRGEVASRDSALRRAIGERNVLEEALREAEREATEAQLEFTAELARRDLRYEQERAELIASAEKFLETEGGLKYLELVNQGDAQGWSDAKSIYESRLEATRIRQRLEMAALERAHAPQAMSKFELGQERIEYVIELYEKIVLAVSYDYEAWAALSELYIRTGSLEEAGQAITSAEKYAETPRQMLWASTLRGRMFEYQGFFARAQSIYNTNLDLALSDIERGGRTRQSLLAALEIYSHIADLYLDTGELQSAADTLARMNETLVDLSSIQTRGGAEDLKLEAAYYDLSGRLALSLHGCTPAFDMFEKQKNIAERLEVIAPGSLSSRSELASARYNLATAWTCLGYDANAQSLLQANITEYSGIVDFDPDYMELQENIALSYVALGKANLRVQEFEQAVDWLQEAHRLANELVNADKISWTKKALLGEAKVALADAYVGIDAHQEARDLLRGALQLFGSSDADLGLQEQVGKAEEAEWRLARLNPNVGARESSRMRATSLARALSRIVPDEKNARAHLEMLNSYALLVAASKVFKSEERDDSKVFEVFERLPYHREKEIDCEAARDLVFIARIFAVSLANSSRSADAQNLLGRITEKIDEVKCFGRRLGRDMSQTTKNNDAEPINGLRLQMFRSLSRNDYRQALRHYREVMEAPAPTLGDDSLPVKSRIQEMVNERLAALQGRATWGELLIYVQSSSFDGLGRPDREKFDQAIREIAEAYLSAN